MGQFSLKASQHGQMVQGCPLMASVTSDEPEKQLVSRVSQYRYE